MTRFLQVSLYTALTLMLLASTAVAQKDATSKGLGNYGSVNSGRSAGRSVRHAMDYSRGFQTYAKEATRIAPEVARREAAGISQNLTAAKKEYETLRKAAAEDKEALAILDSIQKHIATADKEVALLHDCCKKEEIDGKMVMTCCTNSTAALEKIHAEHEKLMKHIEAAHGVAGTPPATKK